MTVLDAAAMTVDVAAADDTPMHCISGQALLASSGALQYVFIIILYHRTVAGVTFL